MLVSFFSANKCILDFILNEINERPSTIKVSRSCDKYRGLYFRLSFKLKSIFCYQKS
jgi:hypothetical protein